ncbi:hypothetical protein [Pseudoalteromonas sp. JC3]|uniref:hypothetical protein n=1 Tax=Pseudoalteromonas sp. JC3 TaxID=2810196 RepID=UPI0019D202C1|nr:hypothetical protein [Pseudoalteromonas sp. JC3]MBR8842397.1 hypothetical protein [Pseudoalteromonas sp. JC3]WJE09483.1 hypothetical protein QSH61_03135 [Pseudoalteromonas sp. JC3]
MGIFIEWSKMSMLKKVSVAASFATIVGTLIAGYSAFVSSGEARVNQTINGEKNTVIGEVSGQLTINYNDTGSKSQNLVLRNRSTGVSLIISEPNIMAATDKSKHVCNAIAGTPVVLTGRVADMSGIPMWKEVSILKGDCAGKVGWASVSVLGYD